MSRFVVAAATFAFVVSSASAAERPPNIVLIVADDLGLLRTRLLRPEADQDAEHRQARGRRDDVLALLCRQRRLRAVPLRADDRQAHGARHHPQQRAVQEGGGRAVPDPCRRCDRRRTSQATRLRHRRDGQVGARHVRHHRQPAQARLRSTSSATTARPTPTAITRRTSYRNDTRHRTSRTTTARPASTTRRTCSRKKRSAFIEKNREKPFFLFLPFIVPHVGGAGAGGFARGVQGQARRRPGLRRQEGLSAPPRPTCRLRRDGDAHGSQCRPHRREAEVARPGEGHARHLHERQRPDAQRRRRGFDLLPLGRITLRGLKGSLYEGGIRVPFIAYWPGTHQARHRPATTRFYFPDLLPTLCELAGQKPPAEIDGISFLPALLGKREQKTHDFLYWEFPAYGGQQAVHRRELEGGAAESGQGDRSKTELYDLADRRERNQERRGEAPGRPRPHGETPEGPARAESRLSASVD